MLQAASPRKVTVSPASVALVLAHGEQVGQQLAGVEVVGERVDDRHAGVRRHLLDAACAKVRHTIAAACRPSTRAMSATDSRVPIPARCRRRIIGLPPSSAMPAEKETWVRASACRRSRHGLRPVQRPAVEAGRPSCGRARSSTSACSAGAQVVVARGSAGS